MKIPVRLTILFILMVFCREATAREIDPPQEPIGRHITFERVTVEARRPLTGIGTQMTELDTLALRDNITKSIADVLSQNSSIFIKSYGRATLSTASFRGTAPSHTQVTWNDMKLNSPMLGMVDFSLIPSYFIDDVTLYHGASSVGVTGGGLGGAISLDTRPTREEGPALRYVQGISSYSTYDQFLKFNYGGERLKSTTRLFYARSDNDFSYTNYRKKDFIYNDAGEIVDFVYPKEKNRNGSFKDLHLQQELYYRTRQWGDLSLSGWYMDSRRGVPMLNVDYKDESQSRNRQDERTFRIAGSWDLVKLNHKVYGRAGYTYTDLRYRYLGDVGTGTLVEMIHSRSYVNTAYGKAGADYYIGEKWLFSGNIGVHQHFIKSIDRAIVTQGGEQTTIGYDQSRVELSAFAAIRYRPTPRLGLAANIREELYGSDWTPVIPALFAEYTVSHRGNVILKTSVARNYRYPTLNDLYFMPSGNPDLRPEKGITYDAGVEAGYKGKRLEVTGEATYYDSYIKDWILWLPTFKGFWSPVNVKEVHSYGVELKAKVRYGFSNDWWVYMDGNYTLSKAINHGDPVNWADNSIGKQLVYIPKYSNGVTGKIGWRNWIFTYKYLFYSERFTTSSNETHTKIGRISPYHMSDISLERAISTKIVGLNLKIAVNNLFGEEYESVLSRPMAGRNYGFFIEIIPRLKKKK